MQKDRKDRKPNDLLRYEREKRGWSQSKLAELIGADPTMVSRWETGERGPDHVYQEKLCNLFKKDAVELGFVKKKDIAEASSEALEPAKFINTPQAPSTLHLTTYANLDGRQPIQIILPNGISPHAIAVHIYPHAITSTSNTSEEMRIVDSGMVNALMEEPLSEVDDIVNRRDFNRKALRVAAATLAAPDELLNTELLERFQRALKKPSTVDERFLNYLEINTARYWHDRHGAVLASSDLFNYAVEHFEKILALLEGPMSPSVRTRLCSLASKSALLIGELLLDMSYYARARDFQKNALLAAQETDNQALAVVSWGRLGLSWIYSKDSANALTCVQKARSLAANNSTTLVKAWLAAIEAEAQVNLHHWEACLGALDEAEHLENGQASMEDSYLIHFDQALLGGYQGVCFRKLYRPDTPQSTLYLEKAQSVLTNSLEQLNPTLIQRKPTFLADLADISLQRGEIEQACEQASQAASIAAKIKLQKVMKRLFSLRKELEPWKGTQYVKNLDNHLASLVEAGR